MSAPSSTPDSDRTNPVKKRVRSEAQLARKRLRDRESQRVAREKNKERVVDIEAELTDLRTRYESLLAQSSNLTQQRATPLDQGGHELGAVTNTPTPEGMLAEHTSLGTSGPNASTTAPPPRDWMSMLLTRQQEHVPYDHANSARSPQPAMAQPAVAPSTHSSALSVDWTPAVDQLPSSVLGDFVDPFSDDSLAFQLRTGAGLYQAIPPTVRSRHNFTSSALLPSEAENKLESGYACTCGLSHKQGTYDRNNSFCVELEVFKLLYDAHTEIASGVGIPRPYPRSPSVANLLLIDVDTTPVTRAIGKLLRIFGSTCPRELADTMAMYFMFYRLLRVRTHLLTARWICGSDC